MASPKKAIRLSGFRYDSEPHVIVAVEIPDRNDNGDVVSAVASAIDKLLVDGIYDDGGGRGRRPLFAGEVLLLNGPMSVVISGALAAAFAQRGFGVGILEPKLQETGTKVDKYRVVCAPAGQYAPGSLISAPRRR